MYTSSLTNTHYTHTHTHIHTHTHTHTHTPALRLRGIESQCLLRPATRSAWDFIVRQLMTSIRFSRRWTEDRQTEDRQTQIDIEMVKQREKETRDTSYTTFSNFSASKMYIVMYFNVKKHPNRLTERLTDGRTDGQTDQPTERLTDGRTQPPTKMHSRS